YGIIAGMSAGAVMVFVWKFGIAKIGGIFAIYELLPAFIVGLAAIVIVSLVTKVPEKEIVQEFESVSAELKS
ncbi:MAG: sodium:proline symporter, partial [Ruminococcus sp.]|nr:sodium:proline symporter [Ruminococcus sp.]